MTRPASASPATHPPGPDPVPAPAPTVAAPVVQTPETSTPASTSPSLTSSSFPETHSSIPFAELPVPFPDYPGTQPAKPTPVLTTDSGPLSDLSAPAAPTTPTGPLPDLNDDSLVSPVPEDTPAPAGFPETSPLSDPFVLPPAQAPRGTAASSSSSQGAPQERTNPYSPLPGSGPEEAPTFARSSLLSGEDLELNSEAPTDDPLEFLELGAAPEAPLQDSARSFNPIDMGPPPEVSPSASSPPELDSLHAPLPTPDICPADTLKPNVVPEMSSSDSAVPSVRSTPDDHTIGKPSTTSNNEDPGKQAGFPMTPAPILTAGFNSPPGPDEPNPQNTLPLQRPDLAGQKEEQAAAESPAKASQRRLRWPGVVFPLLFLVLAAIMVYLVLDLSELLPHSKRYKNLPALPQGKPEPLNAQNAPKGDPVAPAVHQVSPSSATQDGGPGPEIDAAPDSGDSKVSNPLIEDIDRAVEGEVALPPLIDLNPSRNALPEQNDTPPEPGEALALFLGAKTLAERQPYMTRSGRSEAELSRSPLARELPPTLRQRILPYIKDNSDEHTEHFFEVSFERDPANPSIPLLVQVSEGEDGHMVVHTDAFLDLYNDELAQFGAVPVKGERTFHVIADAYKRCFEDRIPGADSKSFIKLRQHEQITPRLLAYFEQSSEVSKQISQSDGLLWGRSGICTVTVKWNTDHPGRPYVQLVGIDSFSWQP